MTSNYTQLNDETFAEAVADIERIEWAAERIAGNDEDMLRSAIIDAARRFYWDIVDSFEGAIELGRSDRPGYGLIVELDGTIVICDAFGNRF